MKIIAVYLLFIHYTHGALDGPIDLGYGFDADSVYFPGIPTFNLTEFLRTNDAAEYGGTQLEAPLYFNPHGWSVADIPLERLLVSGVVIDVRDSIRENADAEVTVKDLEQWQKDFGPLPSDVVVIFNFGWAPKYSNRAEYLGIHPNNKNDLHFPGVSKEAAEWLVNTSKVVGVGVDTASIDPGRNKELIAHQILTAANIYIMENLDLANKDLPPRDIDLTVMPVKIINGTGAPLRIIASPSDITFISRILSWIMSIWVMIINLF